jgi:hypothetical protein
MRNWLVILFFILFVSEVDAQVEKFFNLDRLKQRKEKGLGITGYSSRKALVYDGFGNAAKIINEVPAFQQLVILDYYRGSFGIWYDGEPGFIDKEDIIVDFKTESYMSVWENNMKKILREEEIRLRRLNREAKWQADFGETDYNSDNAIASETLEEGSFAFAIAYNFSIKNESSTSIIRGGKLSPRVVLPGAELTVDQMDDFFDILNDSTNYGKKTPKLFNPKIGLVFYRSDNSIVHFIDIDLDNKLLKSSAKIPAMNSHAYGVDNNGNTVDELSSADSIIRMDGFSKKGYEEYMEYFRLLKLNVSSYPNDFVYGAEIYWSHTGYAIEVPKLTAAFTILYGRNAISLGPKYWLGSYYGAGDVGLGAQFSYKYYLSPYGRSLKFYATLDIDYGFSNHVDMDDSGSQTKVFTEQNRFLNNALGIGMDFRIYRYLNGFVAAGFGKGFSGFTTSFENLDRPNDNYSIQQGFLKGSFWDAPSTLVKVGLNYRIITD